MSREMSISLPTAPVEQYDHFWEQPICIYGRKGIGKTTSAMSIQQMLDQEYGEGEKKVLNFRYEAGRRNLPILQVPFEKGKRLSWTSSKQYLDLFCDDDSYAVAVIDSIDVCYEQCYEYVCGEWGVRQPSEAGRDAPAIWDNIKIEFETTLRAILDCQKGLVLLSHEKSRTEVLADGTEYDRWDLSCKPAAAKIVKDVCEFVLHYGYTGTGTQTRRSSDRVMTIRNLDNCMEVACGRNDVFMQPDGKPLFRFKVPPVAEEVGPTILSAYNNELYDYDFDPKAEERRLKAEQRKAEREAKKKGKA